MELRDASFGSLYGLPHVITGTEKSGLMKWYDRVYDVPFSLFCVEDFARACRQNLFPEHIVPRVLAILRDDPLAGMLYEGELFASLASLPWDFWRQSSSCREEVIGIFRKRKDFLFANLDEHTFDEIHTFISMLKNFTG